MPAFAGMTGLVIDIFPVTPAHAGVHAVGKACGWRCG